MKRGTAGAKDDARARPANSSLERAQKPVLSNVQILRFFAAFGVLLSHAADLLIPHHSLFWAFPWTGGVDLFFVISGFIMAWLTWGRFGKADAARSFLLRRCIRIVPPYWFFTTLMIAAALFAGSHVRYTTVSGVQVLTSYAFIPWPRGTGQLNPILSQGWTLNYEAFFYAAFAAALLFRRGLLWLALGFCALALLHPWVPGRLFVLRFYSDPIILEFLGGIAIAALFMTGRRLPAWGPILCALLGAAAFVGTGHFLGHHGGRFVHNGIAAILVGASLVLAPESRRPGFIRRSLQAGGDASYTLYLLHTFTINLVTIVWRSFGLGLPWVGVVAGVVLSISVAMIFYRWVERPVTDALHRWFDMKPPRGAQTVAP